MASDIFSKFADECRNNSELIHLYVSSIDGSQLYQLLIQCLHGSLVIFNKDPSIVDLLGKFRKCDEFANFHSLISQYIFISVFFLCSIQSGMGNIRANGILATIGCTQYPTPFDYGSVTEIERETAQ